MEIKEIEIDYERMMTCIPVDINEPWEEQLRLFGEWKEHEYPEIQGGLWVPVVKR